MYTIFPLNRSTIFKRGSSGYLLHIYIKQIRVEPYKYKSFTAFSQKKQMAKFRY